MNLNQKQTTALTLALALHERVKLLAHSIAGNQGPGIEVGGTFLTIRYSGRSDECHSGLKFELDGEEYDLWFECKGWVSMRRNDEHIYSQRPREDIQEKFEGDVNAFIAVANKILAITG